MAGVEFAPIGAAPSTVVARGIHLPAHDNKHVFSTLI